MKLDPNIKPLQAALVHCQHCDKTTLVRIPELLCRNCGADLCDPDSRNQLQTNLPRSNHASSH